VPSFPFDDGSESVCIARMTIASSPIARRGYYTLEPGCGTLVGQLD